MEAAMFFALIGFLSPLIYVIGYCHGRHDECLSRETMEAKK